MVEKLQSVTTYIVIAVVIGAFIYLISLIGDDLAESNKSDLSENSLNYIENVTGKQYGQNMSIYDEDLELKDKSGDNKLDFALDFLFGKTKGFQIKKYVNIILGVPSFILRDLFRLQIPNSILIVIDWFFNIMVFIALVRYIRTGTS